MPPTTESPAVTARRKIARRLLPFLFLIYATAYMDRVNVGFAGLDMTRDLHFSNEVFGFGAGVFFFGYALLEIPGAMLAQSWSTRKWIAAIMIVWGALAGGTGLIQTAAQFSIIRFFVGVAEGGFFPAVIVYLTHWFRQEDRAKAVALFMTAVPASNAVGGLIAGQLLSITWWGIAGWRWLLILEGLPAVVGGIATFFYLTDWPSEARWLSEPERDWITAELERERREQSAGHAHMTILQAIRTPLVMALALAYFAITLGNYGLVIWLPKMVQGFPGLTITQVSLVASIPWLLAVPAMLLAGWHSDATGERKWHVVLASVLTAAGFSISQIPGLSPPMVMAGFSVAAMANISFYPCFWPLATSALSPAVAAGAFGFIVLIGNLGGFVGPYAIGYLTDLTGTHLAGVVAMAASAIASGAIIASLRVR
jgi:ACS family tartrate transporter-like MFS transporter